MINGYNWPRSLFLRVIKNVDQLDREVKRLTLTVEAQSLNRQSENNLIKAVVSDRLVVNLWTGKVAPLDRQFKR